jgi:hypothetical protein
MALPGCSRYRRSHHSARLLQESDLLLSSTTNCPELLLLVTCRSADGLLSRLGNTDPSGVSAWRENAEIQLSIQYFGVILMNLDRPAVTRSWITDVPKTLSPTRIMAGLKISFCVIFARLRSEYQSFCRRMCKK